MAFLAAGGQFIATNDLHIFMAMGQDMAQSGQFMEIESFTWTAKGAPFIHGPWGFSLLSWWIYDCAGLFGLRAFNGLMAAFTVALLGRAAILRGADTRAAAFSCLFVFMLLFQNLAVRAQTWAYPLFALLIWWGSIRRPPKADWIMGVIIGCLWANIHGSFPAALVFLALTGAGHVWKTRDLRAAKTSIILFLAFAAGTCIGPNGPGIYEFGLSNSGRPRARGLSEWSSPQWFSISGVRLALALSLWALLTIKRPRALAPNDWLPVLAFAGLSFTGTRFISWFGLASAVPLSLQLSKGMTPSPGIPLPLLRKFFLVFGLLWTLMLVRGIQPRDQELRTETPTLAVAAIQTSAPAGRVLNPPEYGGYARFELGSAWEISSDMRVWVFDDAAWYTYPRLAQAPENWSEQLDQAGVTHLLLLPLPFHDPLIKSAKESPDWKLLAEDDSGLAFQRRIDPVPATR